jgi:hypothetical protein
MDLDAQHSRRAIDVIARFPQVADIANPKLACAADPCAAVSEVPTSIEGKIPYYVDQTDVIGIHQDRCRKDIYIAK